MKKFMSIALSLVMLWSMSVELILPVQANEMAPAQRAKARM